MTFQTLKRAGLAMAAVLALFAFVAVGSAAAATQHWASSSQVPYGSSQEFTGKATSNFILDWEFSGAYATIVCGSLSTSGTAANPAGGGSGTLSSNSFALGSCSIGIPNCSIKNGSIPLEGIQNNVYAASGEDRIEYKRSGGTIIGTLNIVGTKCALLYNNYPIEGTFSPNAISGHPGEYEIQPENTTLTIFGEPITIEGGFSLSTTSGKGLVLSSGASSGAPHWYVGSADWTTLASGSSTAYSNNGPMTLSIGAEAFGTWLEVSCTGSGSGIAGSLENPTGGGAGTTTATFTVGTCTLPKWGALGCTLSPIKPFELSGVATEVGEAHTPAVEFTPTKGSVIGAIVLTGKGCNIKGNFPVEGTLIATSEGDGYYDLSASQLAILEEPAIVSGRFALQSTAGATLRLQP